MRRSRSPVLVLLLGLVAACGEPTEAPPIGPSEVTLDLTAQGIVFVPTDLAMMVGSDLTIGFENADVGIPHGLVLYGGPNLDLEVVQGEVFVGRETRRVRIGPLVAGQYRFSCPVHPNMIAALFVGAPLSD